MDNEVPLAAPLFDPSPEFVPLFPACRLFVGWVGFGWSPVPPDNLEVGRSNVASPLLKLTLTGFAEMREYTHKRKMNDFRYIAVDDTVE